MVPRKGHDAYAIKIMSREVSISRYAKMVLKSDQVPAIRESVAAVRRETRRSCDSNRGITSRRTQEQWRGRESNPEHSGTDEDKEACTAIMVQEQDSQ